MSEVPSPIENQQAASSDNRIVDEDSVDYWQGLVKEIEAERDHYKELAYTDELTQLPNRRYFHEMVEKNFGKVSSLLVIVDINDFGEINNRYGHDKGDEALRAIAKVLQESVRKDSDVVARLGGDEFVILGSASSGASEEQIVPSLRKRIDPRMKEVSEKLGVSLGVSMGAAVSRKDQSENFKEVYKKADQNMYKEKGEIKTSI